MEKSGNLPYSLFKRVTQIKHNVVKNQPKILLFRFGKALLVRQVNIEKKGQLLINKYDIICTKSGN